MFVPPADGTAEGTGSYRFDKKTDLYTLSSDPERSLSSARCFHTPLF